MLSKSVRNNNDFDELKFLKEDLEDLQNYLNEFAAFLPLPVVSVNPFGFILDINRAFENLVGASSVKILGRQVSELFVERKKFLKLQTQVIKGKFIKGQRVALKNKSVKIPLSIYLSPRKDFKHNVIGYFIGIYDITEIVKLTDGLEEQVRKRTSELEQKTSELIKSREALMNILEDVAEDQTNVKQERDKTLVVIENMTDGLIIFNDKAVVNLINPQVNEFFKIGQEKIIGRSIKQLLKIDSVAPLGKFLGSDIKQIYRKRLELATGMVLEITVLPLFSGKQALGKMVILHDVTREKAIESMKTEFVSIAAHQLRTPLTIIKWSLHLMKKGSLGKVNKQQKELLERTYQNNERMISLVNYLLDVTRIEQGRFVYRSERVDFISLVAKIINSYDDLIKKKNLKVIFIKPRGCKRLFVDVDQEKMILVVQNLVDNAINYSRPGGRVRIIIKYNQIKQEIMFLVQDDGIGIPEQNKNRIFTKFYRAENAVMAETEGSGLGLFITKNIVEGHSGRIWFESQQGKGTTFSFILPIKHKKRNE